MINTNYTVTLLTIITLSLLIYSKKSSADAEAESEVDWTKTKIWGPGLKAGFLAPARYFFVQLRTASGDKYV